MTFLNLALFLPSEVMKHFSQVEPQFLIEYPAATFRDKDHMILALPRGVA
jgi:hypothetical protein